MHVGHLNFADFSQLGVSHTFSEITSAISNVSSTEFKRKRKKITKINNIDYLITVTVYTIHARFLQKRGVGSATDVKVNLDCGLREQALLTSDWPKNGGSLICYSFTFQ